MKTLITICALLVTSMAWAASVELSWDANPVEDKVTTYRVYFGNYSGNANLFTSTGYVEVAGTTTTATVRDLSPYRKWFFRATALNDTGESYYSNFVAVQFIRTPANLKFQKLEIR